tara:strand:+ start:5776 stop:5907 length:132 start_codon:yes stop_codon:yes gene_type:complete
VAPQGPKKGNIVVSEKIAGVEKIEAIRRKYNKRMTPMPALCHA